MSRAYVFDVNVLVSASLFENSTPWQAYDVATRRGALVATTSIIRELRGVLRREKFDRYASLERRMQFVDDILATASIVETKVRIEACRDPDDDKFLELAVAEDVDCIVTGDDDLLVLHPFRDIPILTPDAFLSRF